MIFVQLMQCGSLSQHVPSYMTCADVKTSSSYIFRTSHPVCQIWDPYPCDYLEILDLPRSSARWYFHVLVICYEMTLHVPRGSPLLALHSFSSLWWTNNADILWSESSSIIFHYRNYMSLCFARQIHFFSFAPRGGHFLLCEADPLSYIYSMTWTPYTSLIPSRGLIPFFEILTISCTFEGAQADPRGVHLISAFQVLTLSMK